MYPGLGKTDCDDGKGADRARTTSSSLQIDPPKIAELEPHPQIRCANSVSGSARTVYGCRWL